MLVKEHGSVPYYTTDSFVSYIDTSTIVIQMTFLLHHLMAFFFVSFKMSFTAHLFDHLCESGYWNV